MAINRDKDSRDKGPLETTVHFGPQIAKGDHVEPAIAAGVKTRARELFDALSDGDKSRVEVYLLPSQLDAMKDDDEDESAAWNTEERGRIHTILRQLAEATDVSEKNRIAKQLQ